MIFTVIFFFNIIVVIWAVGINFPPRHAMKGCPRRGPAAFGKDEEGAVPRVGRCAVFHMGSHEEMIAGSEREEAARCSRNASQRLLGFYQRA